MSARLQNWPALGSHHMWTQSFKLASHEADTIDYFLVDTEVDELDYTWVMSSTPITCCNLSLMLGTMSSSHNNNM